MRTIKIEAGTSARNNVAEVKFADDKRLEDKELFGIEVVDRQWLSPGHVRAEIRYKDIPDWWGSSELNRRGSVTLPLSVLIEMTAQGLLGSNYELSSAETKKLLLAVASGSEKISDRQGDKT